MEMLVLQPSLEPELYVGETAPIQALLGVEPTLLSRWTLLVPLSKAWESARMLTSLNSVALSGNGPQKECSFAFQRKAFNFLIFFRL